MNEEIRGMLDQGARLFGVDPGYRYVKAAEFRDGVVAKEIQYINALGDAPEQKIAALDTLPVEERLIFEGWSAGQWAAKFGRADHRIDENWLVSEEFKKIVLSACVALDVQDGDRVIVSVPIPISKFGAYKDRVKFLLEGPHMLTLRGEKPVRFELVPKVAAQGVAALVHHVYNWSGKQVKKLSDKTRLVIDPGGGTCQTVLLRGLGSEPKFTKSRHESGYWQVVEACRPEIEGRFQGANVSDLVLAEGVEKGFWKYYGEHDISDIVEEAEQALVGRHLKDLEQYPLEEVDEYLICGGTGEKLFESYEQSLIPSHLIKDPKMANCYGAIKLLLI